MERCLFLLVWIHWATFCVLTRLESHSIQTLHSSFNLAQDTMLTRGVASVRSPVCNLKQFSDTVDHHAFTSAVVKEFKEQYSINSTVGYLPRTEFAT